MINKTFLNKSSIIEIIEYVKGSSSPRETLENKLRSIPNDKDKSATSYFNLTEKVNVAIATLCIKEKRIKTDDHSRIADALGNEHFLKIALEIQTPTMNRIVDQWAKGKFDFWDNQRNALFIRKYFDYDLGKAESKYHRNILWGHFCANVPSEKLRKSFELKFLSDHTNFCQHDLFEILPHTINKQAFNYFRNCMSQYWIDIVAPNLAQLTKDQKIDRTRLLEATLTLLPLYKREIEASVAIAILNELKLTQDEMRATQHLWSEALNTPLPKLTKYLWIKLTQFFKKETKGQFNYDLILNLSNGFQFQATTMKKLLCQVIDKVKVNDTQSIIAKIEVLKVGLKDASTVARDFSTEQLEKIATQTPDIVAQCFIDYEGNIPAGLKDYIQTPEAIIKPIPNNDYFINNSVSTTTTPSELFFIIIALIENKATAIDFEIFLEALGSKWLQYSEEITPLLHNHLETISVPGPKIELKSSRFKEPQVLAHIVYLSVCHLTKFRTNKRTLAELIHSVTEFKRTYEGDKIIELVEAVNNKSTTQVACPENTLGWISAKTLIHRLSETESALPIDFRQALDRLILEPLDHESARQLEQLSSEAANILKFVFLNQDTFKNKNVLIWWEMAKDLRAKLINTNENKLTLLKRIGVWKNEKTKELIYFSTTKLNMFGPLDRTSIDLMYLANPNRLIAPMKRALSLSAGEFYEASAWQEEEEIKAHLLQIQARNIESQPLVTDFLVMGLSHSNQKIQNLIYEFLEFNFDSKIDHTDFENAVSAILAMPHNIWEDAHIDPYPYRYAIPQLSRIAVNIPSAKHLIKNAILSSMEKIHFPTPRGYPALIELLINLSKDLELTLDELKTIQQLSENDEIKGKAKSLVNKIIKDQQLK